MSSGLSGATMIVNRLVANTTGSVPLSSASVSLSMFAVSAEANTSAGAPSVICCTSADEASKLNVAVASGLAAVNASPISVNDSVNDAAANTVMSPASPGAEPVGASDVPPAVGGGAGSVVATAADPATTSADIAIGTANSPDVLLMSATVVRSSAQVVRN